MEERRSEQEGSRTSRVAPFLSVDSRLQTDDTGLAGIPPDPLSGTKGGAEIEDERGSWTERGPKSRTIFLIQRLQTLDSPTLDFLCYIGLPVCQAYDNGRFWPKPVAEEMIRARGHTSMTLHALCDE